MPWVCNPMEDKMFFFFNDTATTEIYTLSLHDALPISIPGWPRARVCCSSVGCQGTRKMSRWPDRKSTRLNSSHVRISYAVFCLKKKKQPRCVCRWPCNTSKVELILALDMAN